MYANEVIVLLCEREKKVFNLGFSGTRFPQGNDGGDQSNNGQDGNGDGKCGDDDASWW